jgi:hypothetical protein
MSLISKETLLTHLQRAEMASDVRLPIEFFRDLVYQAMPRTWVGLTDEEIAEVEDEYIVDYRIPAGSAWNFAKDIEAKLKEKNT